MTESSGDTQLSLGRTFLTRFRAEFPDVRFEEAQSRGEGPMLKVPAVHPEVGDLCVWADREELTVGIGEHHHGHHSLYMYSDLAASDAEDAVVEETLDFIRALFDDLVVLGLSWDGDRLRWSHTYRLGPENGEFRGAVGYREYTWSGPRPVMQ